MLREGQGLEGRLTGRRCQEKGKAFRAVGTQLKVAES